MTLSGIVHKPYEKRFLLALLIVAVLAYLFWTGSRYPALNEKAVMSGAIQLEDVLSFEATFPITTDMTLLERIFRSTLNWISTNKKGMTFGVLFAAAFLTAGSYLRRKSFEGGFSNSLLGLVIGTPLGVCVNCAAPIARGMYTGGLRAETTLSAMVASPTLNIVVLTMLFSLMPVYMALTKIALSLLIILIAVPLICRLLPRTEIAPDLRRPQPWSEAELGAGPPPTEGVPAAVLGVIVAYLRNLWYIVRMTVPLMILAGFLGTVVAIFLPGEALMTTGFSALVLAVVVLAGVFLPVPIGFDVVMAGVLLTAGLDQGYVMALLFTLGSFSVYSWFIVTQALGLRAGGLMAAAVAICGYLAGIGAQGYHEWQTERALRELLGGGGASWGAAMAGEADPWVVTSADADRIQISAQRFFHASPPAQTGFTRLEAREIGIDKPLEFSFRDMWPPFWEGRSVTSGDIDQDGDVDLVIASTEAGLYLYRNEGGVFSRIDADMGVLADLPVFNAALVDVDNDGWRDMVVATYRGGNYLWRNVDGSFGAAPPEPIAAGGDPEAPLAMALSFGDPDRDGDLDLALGNWAAGWYRRIPGEESRNRILWNEAGRLGARVTDLPGIPGETLSILFTDLDDDGAADLIVGNDFDIPDYIYMGDGAGAFAQITHGDGIVPHVTTTTMAVGTGDLSGNLRPELYLAQISGRSSGVSKKLKMQPLTQYCDGIQDPDDKVVCARNMQIKSWYKAGNNFDPTYASKCRDLSGRDQAECKAMLVKDLAIQRGDAAICALIPEAQPIPRSYCDLHFQPVRAVTAQEAEDSIQQVLRSNVLLEWDGATLRDSAGPRGLEVGGWSWDTKLGDFDNDGDLDVYIVNGTWVPNEVSPSNLFFENDGTGRFTESSGPFGLEDYLMTASATQFDMDGDGDLDFLTHPVNGPLTVFRNNAQGLSISFALDDRAGNRDGIGARIIVTDTTGHTQMREVQLGGGFMSFDAPVAHFGLGAARRISQARIRWASGGETVIAGPLEAGAQYRVMRQGTLDQGG
ncbi:FG-GAP-like repeat-containing protein [Salipiger aestuarii]|uniref:Uncharacterized membrane protein YraQ (UPF0718 family) n=1 Tax=Salipiger aestuarii TaxID=568098 RepID=A0A327XYJ1_9RHOB|nr:FG-GAP-like repeat-containing protein [Salipiger aestuarii]EIE50718.1 ASPIC/UnbV domain-containing protein [Citreicella sp. 357]KAA8608999.1 RNA-binding protein [Salipiger aestuarii]KAB2533710.1 RNA-binding protein [Salipiger aestuarii]RAK13211.1 uncharacterized membrane protein YraQ (UPF0718 family) [Salipiger aestuarii]